MSNRLGPASVCGSEKFFAYLLLGTSDTAIYTLTELKEIAMASLNGITHTDPDILSGTPVFVDTRVPVRSLFDYLEGGDSLEVFLAQFPSVKREQAVAVLDAACEKVTAEANSA